MTVCRANESHLGRVFQLRVQEEKEEEEEEEEEKEEEEEEEEVMVECK